MQAKSPPLSIVVLGAGSIGVSFAAVFSDAGFNVALVDPGASRRDGASAALDHQRAAIEAAALTVGAGGDVEIVAGGKEHLASADMVIECGPEQLDIKQAIFQELLENTRSHTVLATASSAITISQIVPDTQQQSRCLVAHPVNPPAVLRVVELVPAPGTRHDCVETASQLFKRAGFEPVKLGKEIEGFVLNRLQGAVLREAYRLVGEGVSDVEGVETIMRLGLGPRWAFSGPFETAELNTPGGIKAHAKRMGPAYKRMGEARGESVEWSDELVDKVAQQRRTVLPESAIPARTLWRSGAVAALVAKRNELMQASQLIDSDDNQND